MMIRGTSLALAMLIGSAGAAAAEYQIKCTFEPSAGEMLDPVAKAWNAAPHLREREFLIEIDPPKLIEPKDDDVLWKDGDISLAPKEITIQFRMHLQPIKRQLESVVTIDRFSGKAFENFLMRENEDGGRVRSYAGRFGACEIHARKL